jgi:hypothetical protein
MSSSDAVLIVVSVTGVFAFTGVMIWWMMYRIRIRRELMKSLEDVLSRSEPHVAPDDETQQ